jgi:hypothetical protein
MATAFDYTSAFGQGGPFGGFAQGIQTGAQLAQMDERRALAAAQQQQALAAADAERQKVLAQQAAMQRAQDYQTGMARVLANPNRTWADFEPLIAIAPNKDQIDAIKAMGEQGDKRQLESRKAFTQQLLLAVESDPEIAKRILDDRIGAETDAGRRQTLELGRQMLDISPEKTAQMIELSGAMEFGKGWYDGVKSVRDERRAAALAPATLAAKKRENIPSSILEAIDYANLTPEQQKTFTALQVLKKPPAAVTRVEITNLEKGTSAELAKLVPDLYEQANSAASQLDDLPRYRAALNSAITGPFADQRLAVARVANALGFTGSKGITATTELIQGNADMALKSRSLLTGQGQITEGEQKLLLKARSADINFTKDELNTLFDVFDRAARAQYAKSTNLLKSAAGKSETAQMFLSNIKPLSAPTQEAAIPGAPTAAPQMPTGFRVIR